MTTEAYTSNAVERSRLNNRLRALVTQENIITLVVALIVAGAVIVPHVVVLFVSSFKVLDPLGWDTTWGFGNYVTMFTDRIIPKAFVNTLIISTGSTVLATGFWVFRWPGSTRAPTARAGAILSPTT